MAFTLLEDQICRLCIDIHDVTILCGVSQHILFVRIDGIICDAVTNLKNI